MHLSQSLLPPTPHQSLPPHQLHPKPLPLLPHQSAADDQNSRNNEDSAHHLLRSHTVP